MPIAPPSSAHDLWPRVNALVEWPDTDEDRMRLLAAEWGEAAGHTEPLSRLDLGPIGAAWADPAGQAFHGRMSALGAAAGEVGARMRALQTLTAAFATDVTSAKQTIVDVINANIPLYAKAGQLDPAVAAATQDRFVTEIAAWLNAYLASLAGHGPPPPPFVPPEGPAQEEENWGKWIGDLAGVVSAVAGTAALIPPLTPFAAPIALIAGGVALAGHAYDFGEELYEHVAHGEEFDAGAQLTTLVSDGVGLVPGVAALRGTAGAFDSVSGFLTAAASTGSDAAPYLRYAADQFTGNAAHAETAAKLVQGSASMFAQTPEFYDMSAGGETAAAHVGLAGNVAGMVPQSFVNALRGVP